MALQRSASFTLHEGRG